MKNITLEQWENKYVKGEITRFDQKKPVFLRPGWDPEINSMIDDWSLNGPPQHEPGFTLEERAPHVVITLKEKGDVR